MQYDLAWREDDRQIHAELDQLHPERRALRPRDVAGVRTAFDVVEGLWSPTIERARRLPEAARVGVAPLPPDGSLEGPTDGGPDLDPVLAVRADRLERIRGYLARATDADLANDVSPPDDRWPNTEQRVLFCLRLVLREEWWHHRYAARDLSSLE